MATKLIEENLASQLMIHSESDDEESFVVLSRSLPLDSLLPEGASALAFEATELIDASGVHESLKLTSAALSQLDGSSSSFPSIPKVEQDLELNPPEVLQTSTTTSADLSPDDIQQRIDLLIEENMKLKETLYQNNLSMKKQYDVLVHWQEDVMKVHESHKLKFKETKKYMQNMQEENARLQQVINNLKSDLSDYSEEISNLTAKINGLKENGKCKSRKIHNDRKTDLRFKDDSNTDSSDDADSDNCYHEQVVNLQQQLTILSAERVVDRDAIAIKDSEITKLQKQVVQMYENADTITALRAQLELYKSDFEAERSAKDALKHDKEEIADDLRSLQRRNEELLKEVERLRGSTDFVHVSSSASSSAPSAPQDVGEVSYICPKCSFKFRDYPTLENHVYRCIDIDDTF